MTAAAPPYHFHVNRTEDSLRESALPPYSEHAGSALGDEGIELATLSRSTSASSSASAAAGPSSSSHSRSYTSSFTPAKQLQIQTAGKNLISLPTPTKPEPIPIFTLTPEGDHLDRPLYLSVRPSVHSGSCFLTHGDDETQSPLSTTTYRFGPGRPPIIVLGDPTKSPAIPPPSSPPQAGEGEAERDVGGFEITGRSLFTRAVGFHVPGLGTFGWRYGNSAERAAADASSLLICEVFVPRNAASSSSPPYALAEGHQKQKQGLRARLGLSRDDDADDDAATSMMDLHFKGTPRRVAQLVRNDAFRTPGTSRSSAGNGGRLMLDLRSFDEKLSERVEWLVVTTAITMLKREVDRRRAQQIAAIGAVVS